RDPARRKTAESTGPGAGGATLILFLVAIAVVALSGVPGLFFDRRSNFGQALSAFVAVAGNGLGLAATVAWFYLGEPAGLALPLSVPGGEFRVAVDGVSCVFVF